MHVRLASSVALRQTTLVIRTSHGLALETDRNLVVTADHSGEAAVPLFALLTNPGKAAS